MRVKRTFGEKPTNTWCHGLLTTCDYRRACISVLEEAFPWKFQASTSLSYRGIFKRMESTSTGTSRRDPAIPIVRPTSVEGLLPHMQEHAHLRTSPYRELALS